MDRKAESIGVGPYLLEVGGAAGTLVVKGEADREAETEALSRALETPEPKAGDEAPTVATEVEAASEATTKIERAVALCKGAAEGHALNPEQLALEVGTLLDCLERLDRKKEHKKAIQMARSLATLLMLLKRWADLLATLRIALRAGKKLGDDGAVAWAEHELGTLHLAAGDVEGADRDLGRAREIRERIGDRRGLAATERNIGVLCERVRSMLREEELVRRHASTRRLSPLRLFAVAAVVLFLFLGGFAVGMVAGDDSDRNSTTPQVTDPGRGNGDDGSIDATDDSVDTSEDPDLGDKVSDPEEELATEEEKRAEETATAEEEAEASETEAELRQALENTTAAPLPTEPNVK